MEPTELQEAIEANRRVDLNSEMSIGERLRVLRGDLSQSEFAMKAGCSRSYLRDIESGRSTPSRHLLARVSAGLGVSLDWILTGVDREAEISLLMSAKKQRDERILKKISTIRSVISLYFSQAVLRKNDIYFSLEVDDWKNIEYLIESLLNGIRADIGVESKSEKSAGIDQWLQSAL